MTKRGILGFRRLTSIGPFSFSESEDDISREEIEELVIQIAEARSINTDELDPADIQVIHTELSRQLFSEPNSTFFRQCMTSKWAIRWEEGVRDITTDSSSEIETLVTKAKGCYSMINSEGFAPMLIFNQSSDDICIPCMLQELK